MTERDEDFLAEARAQAQLAARYARDFERDEDRMRPPVYPEAERRPDTRAVLREHVDIPWAGGGFAPLNIRWSPAENAYALTDPHASVLFVDESFVDQARELKAQLSRFSARTSRSTARARKRTPPSSMSSMQIVSPG